MPQFTAAPARRRWRLAVAAAVAILAGGVSLAQHIESSLSTFVIRPDGEAVPATRGSDGDLVEYRIVVRNVSREVLPPGIVVISVPILDDTTFVRGSAEVLPPSYLVELEFSSDGVTFAQATPREVSHVRWTLLEDFGPNQVMELRYRVTLSGGATAQDREWSSQKLSMLDAFSQAMFGHIGIIQVACPRTLELVEVRQYLICGEATAPGFQLFMQMWDLYSDWEGRVPTVPVPISAWQRDSTDGRPMYTRGYLHDGSAFMVVYIEGLVAIIAW